MHMLFLAPCHTSLKKPVTTGSLFHKNSSSPGGKKPSVRPWHPKRTKKRMVLGDDIGLKDSVNLALCTLVGRTSYRTLCKTDIIVWVQSTWLPLLGYSPEISFLTHGWLGFHLRSPEDSFLLLNGHWLYDGGSLLLKRWGISFNPAQDYFSLHHLWVLLPGLPLYLWNSSTLETIGNSLGKVLAVDLKVLEAPIKRVTMVLMELDIHEGLQESIDIEWRGHTIRQNLDYLGIPFRCTLCRKTGHLRSYCTAREAADFT